MRCIYRNKTRQIGNPIQANDINHIASTETWIKDSAIDEFYLQQCCPNG